MKQSWNEEIEIYEAIKLMEKWLTYLEKNFFLLDKLNEVCLLKRFNACFPLMKKYSKLTLNWQSKKLEYGKRNQRAK